MDLHDQRFATKPPMRVTDGRVPSMKPVRPAAQGCHKTVTQRPPAASYAAHSSPQPPDIVFAYDPQLLKTAVILPDRPEVGIDAHRSTASLPSVVWLRVTIVGIGMVRCAIDPSAITTLSAHAAPTWEDLESVWQTLASAIDRKIRAADFDTAARHRDRVPVVTLTSADVRLHVQQPYAKRRLDAAGHDRERSLG
jgi:hypothetical protein